MNTSFAPSLPIAVAEPRSHSMKGFSVHWLLLSPARAMAVAMVVGLIVGLVDVATGRDFQVVPLYLLPVALASWAVGRPAGMSIAAMCAGLWLIGERLESVSYVHPLVPYSNAAGLFATFASVAWVVCKLHATVNSLEDTVQHRTSALLAEMGSRQLAENARIQSERLAIVGTMSAQLAHEVRNPLGSIRLNVDLLDDQITTMAQSSSHPADECKTLITQFRQELKRIKQVVDGYMSLVRQPQLEIRPVAVNPMLSKNLRMVTGYLTASNVKAFQDFDRDLGFVETDADKLWQVLMNLLGNAHDAMPFGGQLTVRTRTVDNEVQISVIDNGCGMTPEQLAQLNTPFYTTKPNGTGLGLVLVHQIMADLGGHVLCESQRGVGTTFTLCLPGHLSHGSSTTETTTAAL